MAWNVLPPNGGWRYPDPSGTTIEGTDHDNLVSNVAAYRNANHLPLGDPESDVDGYLLGNWPQLSGGYVAKVEGGDEPKKVYGQPVKNRLIERVGNWSANRYSRLGTIDLVDAEDAERRASICIACPQNRKDYRQEAVRNCAPCAEKVASLDVLNFKLRQGKSVVREKSLGACDAAGHENSTAVWLTEKNLRHRKHWPLPEACWMKSLQADEKDSSPS